MNFLDIFQSREAKIRKSHFKNLVRMAAADGRIDREEYDHIVNIAKRYDTTDKEIDKVLKNPAKIKFIMPDSMEERLEQVQDLVSVIMITGEIYPNELLVCKKLARKLGFNDSIVKMLLSEMIDQAKAGEAFKNARARILQDYRSN